MPSLSGEKRSDKQRSGFLSAEGSGQHKQCQHVVSSGREVEDPAALIYELWLEGKKRALLWSRRCLGKLVYMIESCRLGEDRGRDGRLNTRLKLCLVFSVNSPQGYNAVFPCSPRPRRLFSGVATGR